VVVPRPYPALCTREVLVMDFIPGVKLTDVVRHRPKQQQQQQQQILPQQEAAGQQPPGVGVGVGVGESSSSWWGRTIGAYFSRRSVPRACVPARLPACLPACLSACLPALGCGGGWRRRRSAG